MPSGATHDRITLWTLPMVTAMTLGMTRSSELTLIVAGGFLFGGLMLSPDLDLRSRPYKRWGWLRWIWIPYQKGLHHRSFLSHGLIIGTMGRVIYLMVWIAGFSLLGITISVQLSPTAWSWTELAEQIWKSVVQYRSFGLTLLIGLELGATSHILTDTIGSSYKRWQKYGWQGLWKKRKTRKRPVRRRPTPSKKRKRR